jgi:hypothetical protein
LSCSFISMIGIFAMPRIKRVVANHGKTLVRNVKCTYSAKYESFLEIHNLIHGLQ